MTVIQGNIIGISILGEFTELEISISRPLKLVDMSAEMRSDMLVKMYEIYSTVDVSVCPSKLVPCSYADVDM